VCSCLVGFFIHIPSSPQKVKFSNSNDAVAMFSPNPGAGGLGLSVSDCEPGFGGAVGVFVGRKEGLFLRRLSVGARIWTMFGCNMSAIFGLILTMN